MELSLDGFYIGDSRNSRYINIAVNLGMDFGKDWEEARKMYEGLESSVRDEVDKYLGKVERMESLSYRRDIRGFSKRPSKIDVSTYTFV